MQSKYSKQNLEVQFLHYKETFLQRPISVGSLLCCKSDHINAILEHSRTPLMFALLLVSVVTVMLLSSNLPQIILVVFSYLFIQQCILCCPAALITCMFFIVLESQRAIPSDKMVAAAILFFSLSK